MSYVVEEWDYAEHPEHFQKVLDYFSQNKKLLVVIDHEQDESFIIVGKNDFRESDKLQAEQIAILANENNY